MHNPATIETLNPYSPPQAPTIVDSRSAHRPRQYGGIRRLPYLGIMIALGITQNIVVAGIAAVSGSIAETISTLDTVDTSGGAVMLTSLLFMIVSFIPVCYRLKNIGMNPWWCLLMLVPIANLLVGIRCLVCQEGFADTKKLDTAGKVVACVFVGLLVLAIFAVMPAILAIAN